MSIYPSIASNKNVRISDKLINKEAEMSLEERLLYFNGVTVRLSYNEDGSVDMLRIEEKSGEQVVIRSKSVPDAPEKIYELLRECEVI